jgi:type VI secretion system protein ImpH
METRPGAGPDHLTHLARLIRSPETHHIFHALRVIEAAFPDSPRLGESRRPAEDPLRIGQEAELAFPTSTIAALTPPPGIAAGLAGQDQAAEGKVDEGKVGDEKAADQKAGDAAQGVEEAPAKTPAPEVWRLTNRFFGLFGPSGPLPLHLTEYARDRRRNHRDPTFIAFADMLTNRLAGLFYRAYVSAQPAPSFDRALRPGPDGRAPRDAFADRVAAIAGVLGPGFQNRDAMPDMARRHFAGFYGQGARHADGLMAIVAAFVRAPVSLQQFVGSWLALEPDDRWQLGVPADPEKGGESGGGGLGRTTSIGDRVWSRASKFRLRIGPLSLADYTRLLPGSGSLNRLDAVVRSYVGDALDYDVNLVLAADQVPAARIGATVRLGHVGWIGTRIGTRAGARDADELYLHPQALRAATPAARPPITPQSPGARAAATANEGTHR